MKYCHNWKTTLLGVMAFLAYLTAHQGQVLAVLPSRYQEIASTVFGVSILLMGFAAKDAGTPPTPPVPPAAPTPPAASIGISNG
jgi:hypothetical protein